MRSAVHGEPVTLLMSFKQIQDQDVAIRLLRGIVLQGRMPNGLLFWGPGGVGKRMAAHEFAKALNCGEIPDDACDACLSCRKVDHGNFPDILRISPTGKTRIIKVDVIKEVNESAAYRPFESNVRVVIIEDADRMNEAAQNHFLKTLEEPPSNTVFILLTERPRFLLPTIRSRCQSVRFGSLRTETVASMLSRRAELSRETCASLAALSGGSMARALQLIETNRRETVMDVVRRLAAGENPMLVSEGFGAYIQATEKRITAEVMGEKGVQVSEESDEEDSPEKEELEAHAAGLVRQEMVEHLKLFDAWYRDEFVHSASGGPRFNFNRDLEKQLPARVDLDKHAEKLQAISDAWKYIERNMKKQRIFRDLFFVLAS